MSTRLALRPYSPSDPRRITPREDFAREHLLMGEPLFGPGRPDGPCWTLTDGDGTWAQPLACGGFEPRGAGKYACWLYAADLTPRQWVMVARAFAVMVKETKARRVEATIRPTAEGHSWFMQPGDAPAARYAERVGLAYEGTLKSFGPDGADYWLYGGVY